MGHSAGVRDLGTGEGNVHTFGEQKCQYFPGGSAVKILPALQEMWVRSLDREDPLEGEMATHSSILALRIPWTEEPGRLQSIGLQESDMTWQLNH